MITLPVTRPRKFNVVDYILRSLRKQRLRTLLTVSGIAICVAMFILFNAFGEGLNSFIAESVSESNSARYLEMERMLDGWLNILTTILIIVLAVAVANTMLITVTERQREFGTLKALGFSRRQIRELVLLEALAITTMAFLLGCTLGISFAFLFDFLFQQSSAGGGGLGWFFAPAKVTIGSIIYAAFISIVIGTFAALYPAVRAAGLKPAEALRYE
jgi:ABC-type antimicrobial peptide transport system permease subunit